MTSLLDLSDPVVATLYVTIAGLVASVAYNIIQAISLRRLQKAEKGLEHSKVLVRDAFRPWGETVAVTSGEDIPSLLPSDSNLFAKPAFRWAEAHLRSGYPNLAAQWDRTAALVQQEAGLVSGVKKLIAERIVDSVLVSFAGSIKPVDTVLENQWDVYYLPHLITQCWQELRRIANHRDGTPEIGVRSEAVSPGASHLGYRIIWRGTGAGTEIARVKREVHARPEIWQALLGGVLNSESVRAAAREVAEQSSQAQAALKEFRAGVADLVGRVDNGLVLEGKCDLGL